MHEGVNPLIQLQGVDRIPRQMLTEASLCQDRILLGFGRWGRAFDPSLTLRHAIALG